MSMDREWITMPGTFTMYDPAGLHSFVTTERIGGTMSENASIKPEIARAVDQINGAAVILSKCLAGRMAGIIPPEKSSRSDVSHTCGPNGNIVLAAQALRLMEVAGALGSLTNELAEY